DVELQGVHLGSPRGFDGGLGLLGRRVVPGVGDGDGASALREAHRHRASDAARSACNQRRLAFEVLGHLRLPVEGARGIAERRWRGARSAVLSRASELRKRAVALEDGEDIEAHFADLVDEPVVAHYQLANVVSILLGYATP